MYCQQSLCFVNKKRRQLAAETAVTTVALVCCHNDKNKFVHNELFPLFHYQCVAGI